MFSQLFSRFRQLRHAALGATCAALLLCLGATNSLAYEPFVFPTYNLPQGGPLFRGNNPRFHNYQYQHPIPPVLQPDSYFYYRRAPYYTNFAPPPIYPYQRPQWH